MDLSYNCNRPTPNVKNKEPVKKNETERKYSIENDFRTKFKTEKCKFFELNKECKFRESVRKNIYDNKLGFYYSVHLLMEMRI